MVLVSDQEMEQAVRTILQETGQVAELSGAASTAAAFKIKNEFIYHAGRETMHVRIGSVEHKWIPGPAYFAATIKHIRNAKLDEKYNILLTHCFTNLSLVD